MQIDRRVHGGCADVATPFRLGIFARPVTRENGVVVVTVFTIIAGNAVVGNDEFNMVVTC